MIEIKSTLKEAPIRAVIFGKDGVGKSTFCAGAPNAVFVSTEDGLSNIDTQATPTPEGWEDLIAYVADLATDPRCGTIVIDSLDWAEQLLWAHLVATKPDEKGRKVKDIEGYGYGKGYIAAVSLWRVLLNELKIARDNGKIILLIAHAERKKVKNPVGEDYEAWSIKLQDRASGLIREWVDLVGFAELDVSIIEGGKNDRTKAISNGKRILRTQPAAGFESKTRYTLPDRIPLDWPTFSRLVKAGRPATIEELEAKLTAKLAELGAGEVELSCGQFLVERGRTFASLSEAIATVQGYLDDRKGMHE